MRLIVLIVGFLPFVLAAGLVGQERDTPSQAYQAVADDEANRAIADDQSLNYDPDKILVKPKSSARYSGRSAPLAEAETERLGLSPAPLRRADGVYIYRPGTRFYSIQSPKEKIDQLREIVRQLNARDDIEWATLIGRHEPHYTPSDPYYRDMWNYHANGALQQGQSSPGGISLPAAWQYTTGSHDVTVAVLDTGILRDHPDIKSSKNVGGGYDFVSRAKYSKDKQRGDDGEQDSDPSDPGDARTANECDFDAESKKARPDSWHGSHVAGIVGVGDAYNAEGIAGVSPTVRVLPIRISATCGAWDDDIAAGIKWAAALPDSEKIYVTTSNGSTKERIIKKNLYKAKIINISFGGRGECSPEVQDAITQATNAKSIVVVSAGNENVDAKQSSIASCKDVVVVAAGDSNGALWVSSNYGDKVDIMAPGVGILSYVKNDPAHPNERCKEDDEQAYSEGLCRKSGTSMAAPHVAGVLALMAAANPKLTNPELLSILKRTAIKRSRTQCPKPCGEGLINAGAAVKAAVEQNVVDVLPIQPPVQPPQRPKPPKRPSVVVIHHPCCCCCRGCGFARKPWRKHRWPQYAYRPSYVMDRVPYGMPLP